MLESIEGGEKWAQYSIIGLDCQDSIKVSDNKIEIKTALGTNPIECKEPLNELNKLIAEYKSPILDGMPDFMEDMSVFLRMKVLSMLKIKLMLFKEKTQNLMFICLISTW